MLSARDPADAKKGGRMDQRQFGNNSGTKYARMLLVLAVLLVAPRLVGAAPTKPTHTPPQSGRLVGAAETMAVLAGGIIIVNSTQSALAEETALQETITITNASITTGSGGSASVPATLAGATEVTLACADSGCTVPLPGMVIFTNCTNWAPGVCGCELDPSDITDNTVHITLCTGGVSIAPGGSLDLATIETRVIPSPLPFFAHVATGPGDLRACSPGTPSACSTAAAHGSLLLPGAVEASGVISINANQSALTQGSTLQETIAIGNASIASDREANGSVPATLAGVIQVTLACADSGCTVPLPGMVAFTSCTNWAPGVCGCELDPSDITDNTVHITLCEGGVSIPAGAALDLVTINSIAVNPILATGSTSFFTGVTTGTSDLEACSSTTPSLCTSTGVQGSLALAFPASKAQHLPAGRTSGKR